MHICPIGQLPLRLVDMPFSQAKVRGAWPVSAKLGIIVVRVISEQHEEANVAMLFKVDFQVCQVGIGVISVVGFSVIDPLEKFEFHRASGLIFANCEEDVDFSDISLFLGENTAIGALNAPFHYY